MEKELRASDDCRSVEKDRPSRGGSLPDECQCWEQWRRRIDLVSETELMKDGVLVLGT